MFNQYLSRGAARFLKSKWPAVVVSESKAPKSGHRGCELTAWPGICIAISSLLDLYSKQLFTSYVPILLLRLKIIENDYLIAIKQLTYGAKQTTVCVCVCVTAFS